MPGPVHKAGVLSVALGPASLYQLGTRSVTKQCQTPCDRTDCSTPGFPVLQHLLNFVQTHVH